MITPVAQLHDRYGNAGGLTARRSRPSFDTHSRKFISMLPFLMLSTAIAQGKTAGASNRPWEMGNFVALVEAEEAETGRTRGLDKNRI